MGIVLGVDNIVVYRGDTPRFRYQVEDFNKVTQVYTPVDITNFQITGQVRHSLTDIGVWFTFPIVKTDAANGIFEWRVTKAQSDLLVPITSGDNAGIYDMQIATDVGTPDEQVLTFMTGTFTVTRDITRASTPRVQTIKRR